MSVVKVSEKYQLMIPKEIRENLKIQKGQRMIVLAIGDVIQFVPQRDIRELKGFLKGMSTEGLREDEDRL